MMVKGPDHSAHLWMLNNLCDFFESVEYEDVKMKRGGNVGLFPFPRVGRSDPELSNWEPATAALINSLEDYNGRYLEWCNVFPLMVINLLYYL